MDDVERLLSASVTLADLHLTTNRVVVAKQLACERFVDDRQLAGARAGNLLRPIELASPQHRQAERGRVGPRAVEPERRVGRSGAPSRHPGRDGQIGRGRGLGVRHHGAGTPNRSPDTLLVWRATASQLR